MAVVARIGPLPLGRRHQGRVAELEQIFGTAVELVEVFDLIEFAKNVAEAPVRAVAIDATATDQLSEAVRIAGRLPVLRPRWKRIRSPRGEVDEVFAGYGLLSGETVEHLADGALASR